MIEKIKVKLTKEIIMYLIFGTLTTLLNFLVFQYCSKIINLNVLMANIIAWVAGVIFAFITNKLFVFESKSKESKTIFKELTTFTTSRLLTLGLEEIMIFVFITKMGLNSTIIKLIAQFLVVVSNYMLSKIFVFKKERNLNNDKVTS